jgi:hypothetical protein
MIEWYTWVEIGVAVVAGLLAIILGLICRIPADLTVGATLLVELFLIAQLVIAIVAPNVGNPPSGNVLEFSLYLGAAVLVPPLAVFWSLVDRTKWSTVILGIANLAIAIMLYRMYAIWFVQH